MLVTKKSGFTGAMNTRDIPVTPAMLARIDNRSIPIQVLCPALSRDDCEFLITGSTPEEWEAGLPEELPEEEEY
jgi:hypothetical protein